MRLPADPVASLHILHLDTREPDPHPWPLAPFAVERICLPFGDLTLRGFERELVFERKTLNDLLACVGRERVRFEKNVTGLLGHRLPFLVVEANWSALEAGNWPGEMKPSQVMGSLIGWQTRGIHLVLACDSERAGRLVASISYMVLRRAWDRARDLISCVMEELPA